MKDQPNFERVHPFNYDTIVDTLIIFYTKEIPRNDLLRGHYPLE